MSFRIALSGLNAARSDLSTTAHNVANVNTTGFKSSRAEFADVYGVTARGVGANLIGSGVRLSNVEQQFSQGSIEFTDNGLDLAVNGEGFFTLSDGGGLTYSRAGAFGTSREGYVENAQGHRLQVYAPSTGGNFNTGQMTDLQITTSDNPPTATTSIDADINLPASASVPSNTTFSTTDPTSYNHTTSLTTYDSLGNARTTSMYFVKTATANEWTVHAEIGGQRVTPAAGQNVTFGTDGALNPTSQSPLSFANAANFAGANAMQPTLDISGFTQYANNFSVNGLQQNGYSTGRLIGVDVDSEGVVFARFTNGQASALGQLALTSFQNPQGLQQLGDTTWGETFDSGGAVNGAPGTSNFGQIQAGALETSNVNLAEQLVNMIASQRNFQANAQMTQTEDQVTQTIINIR